MWLSLGFDSISACLLPSDICSLSRQEGGKAAATWGKITPSDRIVTTCGGSLWWKSLPGPMEAGAGMWGWCQHCPPCVPVYSGASPSRQILLPLGAFLAMHPHPSVASAVSMEPTVFLFLAQFSQPHVLALSPCQYQWILFSGNAHDWFPRRLRNGWCSDLWSPRSQWRPWPEGWAGPTQKEAPLSTHEWQRDWQVVEGVVMAVISLVHRSTMISCFCGVQHFSHRLSQLWSSLLLSLFLASICPLPGPILPTPLSSNRFLFATDNSWFRLECAEVWCRSCVKFNLLCPAFHRSYTVFFDPGGSFSVPVDFPTLRVFFFFWV